MRKIGVFKLGVMLFTLGVLWVALALCAQAASQDAVWPEASGTSVESDGNLTIDMSHMDQGYIMCCVTSPTKNAFKMRITVNGGQLMYDITNSGEYECYPLQMGSGNYKVELFENVKGSKYAGAGSITVMASLRDENAAFLVPNQYVNYDLLSLTVQKSDELTDGLSKPKDIYDKVCDFMASEFNYDFVRASKITSFTLPEVDPCFERRSGICQDLSAVMICMLRVQGIPSRLMIGYADKYYHAWTVSVVDGQEIFFDPTEAIGAISAKKYQVERFY